MAPITAAAGPAKVLYLRVGHPVRLVFNREVPPGASSSTGRETVKGRVVTITPLEHGFGTFQFSNASGAEVWSVSYVAFTEGEKFPGNARLTASPSGGYAAPVRVKDPAWKGLSARSETPVKWGLMYPGPLVGHEPRFTP